MLCIGGVYAWSIVAAELISGHGFSALQSQVIFGFLIAIFPTTMIIVGKIGNQIKHRHIGYISGFLFWLGYFLASKSQGNFLIVFVGLGVITGVSTGFGYWLSLTSPVKWFPKNKGLITGVAAAGFGLGAVFMSEISQALLKSGYNIMELLGLMGISYGIIIIVASNFIFQVPSSPSETSLPLKLSETFRSKTFKRLFLGIFLGTFAGLLVIGSLNLIGRENDISTGNLVHAVAIFAIANFLGRLSWGMLSDRIGASLSIFLALLVQSISILSLILFPLSDATFWLISFLVGFGFGANFVLFARETAQVFGLDNMGSIYPYVFLGYAIAGVAGPAAGGFIFDISGSFTMAILLASLISLAGGLLFFKQSFLRSKT